MIFGYARVSTKTQARDGNSLDAQQAALTAAGAEKIYTDTFTGTKMDRPEWDRLRAQLRRGDVLIVTRLDRLARSVSQASGLITEMIDEGITINVLNLGILSNDSVNTLLRNVLLSFAQFERDMIVQRTQEGKAVARATALPSCVRCTIMSRSNCANDSSTLRSSVFTESFDRMPRFNTLMVMPSSIISVMRPDACDTDRASRSSRVTISTSPRRSCARSLSHSGRSILVPVNVSV